MRRLAAVSVISTLVILGSAEAASAGGNWLESNERYLVPGEELVVKNRYFSRKDVATGPYFLYLVVDGEEWSPPPRMLENALVLGRVRTLWPPEQGWENRHMPQNPLLIGRVIIPQVESGEYRLYICNRPCTDKMSWLGPALVHIVPSRSVANLHVRIDSLQSRLRSVRYRNRAQGRRDVEQLRRTLTNEIENTKADMEANAAAARRLPRVPSQTPITIAIVLAVAAIALSSVALISFVRSRRRLEPDWDELLREELEVQRVPS